MKSAKFACCRALRGGYSIVAAISLWVARSTVVSEPPQLSAAPELAKGSSKPDSNSFSKSADKSEIPQGSGHTDWTRDDFLGIGSIWRGSSDIGRPDSGSIIPPALDYSAQKKLWEKMDQRRHWMFGNSDPKTGIISPENSLQGREFDPKSDLPKSVLQKRAIDEILHPSGRSEGSGKNRRESGMASDSTDESVAGRGPSAPRFQRESSDSKSSDSWSLRNATENRSWLDWDRRSSSVASDLGQNLPTEISKDARDRLRRFDDLFGVAAPSGSAVGPERDPRGWSTSTERATTHRERLERLFDSTTPPSGLGNPSPGNTLNSSVLGQAQRNELFGDGKTSPFNTPRRSKFLDEAAKRQVFQPQPGELPLPKPNGN